MNLWKKLWPFARKAVTVEVHADVHPDILHAVKALSQGRVIEGIDAIADFVYADYENQVAGAAKSLLHAAETHLRQAAHTYSTSLK